MKKIRLIIVILILFIGGISNGQSTDTLFVYSSSGIWLRENPSIKSEKILLIPYRTEISQIIDILDIVSTIGWTTDYWIKIKFDNKYGYVFNGFLSSFKFPKECDHQEYIDIEKYLKTHYKKHGHIDSSWTNNRYGTGNHLTYRQSFNDSIIFENHQYKDGHCYKLISKKRNYNDGMNLFKAFSETCYHEFKKVFNKAKYFKNNEGIINRFQGNANWESISVWIEETEQEGLMIEICESVE